MEAESLDFARLLFSLVRPAGTVLTLPPSSSLFEVDELLFCVRVLRIVKDAVSQPVLMRNQEELHPLHQ
jgi:hypothetical protein